MIMIHTSLKPKNKKNLRVTWKRRPPPTWLCTPLRLLLRVIRSHVQFSGRRHQKWVWGCFNGHWWSNLGSSLFGQWYVSEQVLPFPCCASAGTSVWMHQPGFANHILSRAALELAFSCHRILLSILNSGTQRGDFSYGKFFLWPWQHLNQRAVLFKSSQLWRRRDVSAAFDHLVGLENKKYSWVSVQRPI